MKRFLITLALVSCQTTAPSAESYSVKTSDAAPEGGTYRGVFSYNMPASQKTALSQRPITIVLTPIRTEGPKSFYEFTLVLEDPQGEPLNLLYEPLAIFDDHKRTLTLSSQKDLGLQTIVFDGTKLQGSFKKAGSSLTWDAFPTKEASNLKDNFVQHQTPIKGLFKTKGCFENPGQIRIETHYWTQRPAYPALKILGRYGSTDPKLCAPKETSSLPFCTKGSLISGTFDPYANTLSFQMISGTKSLSQNYTCSGSQKSWICSKNCSLIYDELSTNQTLQGPMSPSDASSPIGAPLAFPVSLAQPDPRSEKTPSLEGTFYGYLYHTSHKTLQIVALHSRYSSQDNKDPFSNPKSMEVTLSAYFGQGDSDEYLIHELNPVTFPLSSTLLQGPGDASLEIKEWTSDSVKGIWKSKTFGYIGPFELQKEHLSVVSGTPSKASPTLFPSLSGTYENARWELSLKVTPGLSQKPGDFFPAQVHGFVREKRDNSRRKTILDASINPYTLAAHFKLDDGRILKGVLRPENSTLELLWNEPPILGSPLSPQQVETLIRHKSPNLVHRDP